MSTKAIAATASKRQIFMCRKARSNEARPSSENCEDAAPSNQLSVTPRVKAFLSETIWSEPEATRSTPSRRRRPQYPAAPGLAEAFFVVLFGAHSVGSFTVNDLRKVVINTTSTENVFFRRRLASLLIDGLPTKLIAYRLGITARTTEHPRAAIMQKMQARTISHLVRMALGLGHFNGANNRAK